MPSCKGLSILSIGYFILAIIRWFVATLILFFEKVLSQKSVLGDADSLARIDEKNRKADLVSIKYLSVLCESLYEYEATEADSCHQE